MSGHFKSVFEYYPAPPPQKMASQIADEAGGEIVKRHGFLNRMSNRAAGRKEKPEKKQRTNYLKMLQSAAMCVWFAWPSLCWAAARTHAHASTLGKGGGVSMAME